MTSPDESIFQPLTRRRMVASADVLPKFQRPLDTGRWSWGATFLRSLQWLGVGLRFGARLVWERRRGPLKPAVVARHLRPAIEAVGGTAVKFGQQLSYRVDLLPFEFCTELALLTDKVRPYPVAEAIAEIERMIGAPLDTVFSAFDPVPIGSASIACVYKAVLKSGETVAVKVQRPRIAAQFAQDLAIASLITHSLEFFTIVRPGLFGILREELRGMLLEEVDFTFEARFQALFLSYIERDGLRWLTCPRLWRQWCGERVLVSEFVDGVGCNEIIAATETRDPDALAKLAALGIEPRRVGLNIARLAMWGYFETPFLHGDPHPANLMVLPGNRLCVLDFGACSMRSRRTVVHHRILMRHVLADRISEMVDSAIATLLPLPYLDMDAFRHDLEERILSYQMGLRDPTSAWFERTSVSLWASMMEVTRAHSLPVNSDTLRTIRTMILYDTMAYRLNPRLGLSVTSRYLEDAAKRLARRAVDRHARDRSGGPPGIRTLRWGLELGWLLRRTEYKLDTLSRGVVPGLSRLAGTALNLARWFGAWSLAAALLEWYFAPGLVVWVPLSLLVLFGAARLVDQIKDINQIKDTNQIRDM